MPGPTATERTLAARVASQSSWGRTTDRPARTAAARAAADNRFLAEADGDPVRAEHLRKAYFARLALASARSRRQAREAREAAVSLDQMATEAEQALGDAS